MHWRSSWFCHWILVDVNTTVGTASFTRFRFLSLSEHLDVFLDIVDTMINPAQAAALNRVAVQTKALNVKHQLIDLQHSQQPTLVHRTIEAFTRSNPLRMTTAPYAGPPAIMAEAPNAHQSGRLKWCEALASGVRLQLARRAKQGGSPGSVAGRHFS